MENSLTEKKSGWSGTVLKLIAVVTMVIDHIGAFVLEVGVLAEDNIEYFSPLLGTDYVRQWDVIDIGLRLIGRMSFPIFCFLLVEGFFHTRNRKKYAINLLIFAIISEIPFDLAGSDTVFYWDYQNIYFTLFIGLVVMAGMERVSDSYFKQMLVAACGCVAASILKTDYSMWGILVIVSFYLFYGNKTKQLFAGGFAAAMESANLYSAAAVAVLPIWMYNGERGRLKLKYFFYWFYPAHLILLYLIRLFILKEL